MHERTATRLTLQNQAINRRHWKTIGSQTITYTSRPPLLLFKGIFSRIRRQILTFLGAQQLEVQHSDFCLNQRFRRPVRKNSTSTISNQQNRKVEAWIRIDSASLKHKYIISFLKTIRPMLIYIP